MARQIWGYMATSSETVREARKCDEYDMLVPMKTLYGSREAVADAVAADINEQVAEYMADMDDDEMLDLDNPNDKPITGESLEWRDCHVTYGRGRKIWRTYNEDTDQHYVIFEMELI